MANSQNKIDQKEFELPETTFSRDIENRVFQSIVMQTLAKIQHVALAEGNFIDNIFGKSAHEGLRAIQAEQDSKSHSVKIRIEVGIEFGVPIPEKADEIQTKVSEEVTRLTGLHVDSVHVIFKNLIPPESQRRPSLLDEDQPLMIADGLRRDINQ